MGWFDEYQREQSLSKLAGIRAGLDVLIQSDEIDYDKEFVSARVFSVAYDAVDECSYKYNGNKAFAASYMVLDGVTDDRFVDLYNKTYNMSRISSYARVVQAKLSLEGIDVKGIKDYNINVKMFSGDKYVRVYRPLYELVHNMAADMELSTKSVFTALILVGSGLEKYISVYDKYIDMITKSQVIKMEQSMAMVRAYINLYGRDLIDMITKSQVIKMEQSMAMVRAYINLYGRDLIEDFRKTVGISDGETKEYWKIKGVDKSTIELMKKASKKLKKRLGEVLKEAVESSYGWILLHNDDEMDVKS